jgi:microsomal dipeptidase-like Zn-dependent dipeptidase
VTGRHKKIALLLVLLALLLSTIRLLLPGMVERHMNTVKAAVLSPLSRQTSALHQRLFIADMHADSLLWGRDLSQRAAQGHVDLPRLRQAGVGLQVFSIVTKTPHHLNTRYNTADSDDITWLAIVQGWPVASWFSLPARAEYLGRRLAAYAREPANDFMLIRSRRDLQAYLAHRAQSPGAIAGVLSIEGAHALAGDLQQLDAIYAQGVRIVGLAHFFDNEAGGSAHGAHKRGLTAFGRELVRQMHARQMLVDLAHSSAAVFDEVVRSSPRPVIVSHTGVRGTCKKSRNLTDQQLRQVAATGGLVGIGFWPNAVCGDTPQDIIKAIRYTIDTIGAEHVALGSDFDGAVSTPFDVTGLPQLTAVMLASGFTEREIRLVMGENLLRILQQTLPAS